MKRILSSIDSNVVPNIGAPQAKRDAQSGQVEDTGLRLVSGPPSAQPFKWVREKNLDEVPAPVPVASVPLYQSRLGLPLPREIDHLILQNCLPGLEDGLRVQFNLGQMAKFKRVSKGWGLEVTAYLHTLSHAARLNLARRMLQIREDYAAARRLEPQAPGQLAKAIASTCALPEPADKTWEKLAEHPNFVKLAHRHGQLLDPSSIPKQTFNVLDTDFSFWESYVKSYGHLLRELTWEVPAVSSADDAAKLAGFMSHCKNVQRLCFVLLPAHEVRFQPKQWDFLIPLADLHSLDLRSAQLPLNAFPVEVLRRLEYLCLSLPNADNLKGLEQCTGLKTLEFENGVLLSKVVTGIASIPSQIERIQGLTLSADDVPLLPDSLQSVTMTPSAESLPAFIAAFPRLRELTLKDKKLQDRAVLLGPMLEAPNCALVELSLHNAGSTKKFDSFLQKLGANRSLQKFHFSGLRVSQAACTALAAFVRNNPALRDFELSLHTGSLYLEDIAPLLDALAQCSQLQSFGLAIKDGNRSLRHCDPDIPQRLRNIASDNRSFLKFHWVLAGVAQGKRDDLS